MPALLSHLLRVADREVTFERRGFDSDEPEIRERLEGIGRHFLTGYHLSLHAASAEALGRSLGGVAAEVRGFAYEGAGMGLALLDRLAPWKRDRLAEFLRGPGADHVYLVFVGAGWALARLKLGMSRRVLALDPTLAWLAMDGYGFHEGYFATRRTVVEQRVPRRLSGYARRGFDQGLGRSLWFVKGADVGRVAATIAGFAAERAEDLWSGVGLAAAYAGGRDVAALESLRGSAGRHHGSLAQGAAFAATARWRAGNLTPHTDAACRVLCGVPAAEAAAATHELTARLGDGPTASSYETWRTAVRRHFTRE